MLRVELRAVSYALAVSCALVAVSCALVAVSCELRPGGRELRPGGALAGPVSCALVSSSPGPWALGRGH